MIGTFEICNKFNQPSNWERTSDVSTLANVTTMDGMFVSSNNSNESLINLLKLECFVRSIWLAFSIEQDSKILEIGM
jgi:hypothetical protein